MHISDPSRPLTDTFLPFLRQAEEKLWKNNRVLWIGSKLWKGFGIYDYAMIK